MAGPDRSSINAMGLDISTYQRLRAERGMRTGHGNPLLRVDSVHPQYPLGLGEEVEWFSEPIIIGYYASQPQLLLLALGLSNAIKPAALEGLVVQFANDHSPLLWAKMQKFGQPGPFVLNEAGLAELKRRYRLLSA
jgi:hypothetical protein